MLFLLDRWYRVCRLRKYRDNMVEPSDRWVPGWCLAGLLARTAVGERAVGHG